MQQPQLTLVDLLFAKSVEPCEADASSKFFLLRPRFGVVWTTNSAFGNVATAIQRCQ